ncbi:MAG TPA: hypothetical protein VF989_20900 [Polyangiaceae bacterium]
MSPAEQAREALSDAWKAFEQATDASRGTEQERASAVLEGFAALTRAAHALEVVPHPIERIQGALSAVLEAQADERAAWGALYSAAGRAMQAAEQGDTGECVRWLYIAADAEFSLLSDCDRFAKAIDEFDPNGEHDPAGGRREPTS